MNAEVMGRMNDGFQPDRLKHQIRDFKQRQLEGKVETYEETHAEKIEEGNIGNLTETQKMRLELDMLKEQQRKELAEKQTPKVTPTGWHIVPEEKNAFGLLKREYK